MVKYTCYSCHDEDLGASITKVIDHVWTKHRIEVSKKWDLMLPENAHKPQRSMKVAGFRCEECDILLRGAFFLLKHLDSAHGIHVWYERGLTRKRVFFDGILKDDLTKEEKSGEMEGSGPSGSLDYVPLSKRPFDPREKNENEDDI